MNLPQIIEHLQLMDSSIEQALVSGDSNDLEQFYESSSILTKEIPNFKGHLHVPKNLEYLLFSLTYAPIYDLKRKPAPGYTYSPVGYVSTLSGQVLRGY